MYLNTDEGWWAHAPQFPPISFLPLSQMKRATQQHRFWALMAVSYSYSCGEGRMGRAVFKACGSLPGACVNPELIPVLWLSIHRRGGWRRCWVSSSGYLKWFSVKKTASISSANRHLNRTLQHLLHLKAFIGGIVKVIHAFFFFLNFGKGNKLQKKNLNSPRIKTSWCISLLSFC